MDARHRAGARRDRRCGRCAALDPDRYAFTVVNQVLGGGMSSRLFQEIREKRGLAYSVYSYHASFEDAGLSSASTSAPRPNACTRRST